MDQNKIISSKLFTFAAAQKPENRQECKHNRCTNARLALPDLPKRPAALRAEFRHTLSRRGSPPAVCTAGADYRLGGAAVCAEFSAALRAAGRAYPCLAAHSIGRGSRSFLTDACAIHPIHRILYIIIIRRQSIVRVMSFMRMSMEKLCMWVV